MQTHEFIREVQRLADIGTPDDAMRAARAALETLGERIGPEEAHELAAQLPEPLARCLEDAPRFDRFDSDEYLRRVGEREGVGLDQAALHARAVLEILQHAVSAGELEDVLARLPPDYVRLFTGARTPLPPS